MCHLRILVNCKSFFNLSPLSVKVVQTIYIVYYRIFKMSKTHLTRIIKSPKKTQDILINIQTIHIIHVWCDVIFSRWDLVDEMLTLVY